ncbi:hypothetical protein PI124_g10757 [Phytophthora idaei]|nr:hypothetical protein PI125_g18961 [Phytophthora idaei]KAG3163519.1 hypothetical protein PI126_g5505 [Phytophthora idaei]KAG3244480.1 hypothetical protein PI124_g10757 [Phytophthora idaei]
MVVAFLKLFMHDGFELDDKSPRCRDEVLVTGKKKKAEAELLSFLHDHKIEARGAQNVLKSMRKLHKREHLNEQSAAMISFKL